MCVHACYEEGGLGGDKGVEIKGGHKTTHGSVALVHLLYAWGFVWYQYGWCTEQLAEGPATV